MKPPISDPARKKFNISYLWDQHHEILRRVAVGQRMADVARDLGISSQTVSNTVNSVLGRRKLAILRAEMDADTIDLRMRIKELASEAVETIAGIMRSEGTAPAVRLRSAVDILDREGTTSKKVEGHVRHDHLHLTGEQISLIKQRAESSELVANGEVEVVGEQDEG